MLIYLAVQAIFFLFSQSFLKGGISISSKRYVTFREFAIGVVSILFGMSGFISLNNPSSIS